MASNSIFILGAKRTPFCGFAGPFRTLPASHVYAAAAKEAIRTANVDPALIDTTVVGNVNFLSQCDGGKTPRYCGTYSGVPLDKPALGVNKACGTGLQTIISGALDILTGSANITLVGGTELMSALPLLVRNVRFGTIIGVSYHVEDHIKHLFPDSYTGFTLQDMAEKVAKRYNITRAEVDEYAAQSHLKWTAAQDAKVFDSELVSMTVKDGDKEIVVNKDLLPQPTISAAELSKLPTLLDNGEVITSGNSIAPADGAAALLIGGEESVKNHNLKPLARVAGWACVGVDPLDTAIAAVPAVTKLLADHKLTINDIDLFEINETFAAQALASVKELRLDPSKVNVSGGAIAIGHPIAATGARMATHLVHELSRRNLKRGIAASSCGGGQGVAVLLERI